MRNVVGAALHVAEHALPGVPFSTPLSHCSVPSFTLLPHTGAQSLSLVAFAPAGQHRSPLCGCVIGGNTHAAVHVFGFDSVSVVQAMPSLHVVGHLPTPLVIAVSHVSPTSSTPLPQAT